VNFVTAYPVLPWIGVMSVGYCLGTVSGWKAARPQRFLLRLGLALILAFVLNFARHGRTPFLWIAPSSMGGPSDLFPSNYGFPLGVVYAVWIVALLLLYPACLWFARLKQRRHDCWLSYL